MIGTRTLHFISWFGRSAVAAIGAIVLMLGAGRTIHADGPDHLSPEILSVQLRGVEGTIQFRNHTADTGEMSLRIFEPADANGNPALEAGRITIPVRFGAGLVATRAFSVPRPNRTYCFALTGFTYSDVLLGTLTLFSAHTSAPFCVDPMADAAKPDLGVRRIGREQVYAANSRLGAVVELHNSGADAVGNVEFTIMSSGAVTVTEMVLDPGYKFTCERVTLPDHNAAFRCRGGTIPHGESITPFFFFQSGAAGATAILEARVTTTSGPSDRYTSDNYLSHPIILGKV